MKQELMKLEINSVIPNLSELNHNEVFFNILELQRFDLLNSNKVNLHLTLGEEISEKIVYLLLNDEDNIFYLRDVNYQFSEYNIDIVVNMCFSKYMDKYGFVSNLVYAFFNSSELSNKFVDSYSRELVYMINTYPNNIPYNLLNCDKFVSLIIKNKCSLNINGINRYSIDNLKLLAVAIKDGLKVSPYKFDFTVMNRVFDDIDSFNADEFCTLLNSFKYKNSYIFNDKTKIMNNFDFAVGSNMDKLFDKVSEVGKVPFPLLTSLLFREECIKRNRMDLAIQCNMNEELINDDELVTKYAKELGISKDEFISNFNWLLKYSKKNNEAFNLCLANMLGKCFNKLDRRHIERMINDVEFQTMLLGLSDKEFDVLSVLINTFNYKNYDGAFVIYNIVNNVGNYKDLINSVDVNKLTIQDAKALEQLLQDSSNYYGIKDILELSKLSKIKLDKYLNCNKNDMDEFRDSILRYVFSVDLEEGKRINEKYCYDNDGLMLDKLSISELPSNIFDMLYVLNKVVETNDLSELNSIYEHYMNKPLYDNILPFEVCLRSIYTKLYSDSLYKVDKNAKDREKISVNYKGNDVTVVEPTEGFAFMVHCVGSCSLKSDLVSTNYCEDWVDRPQMTDHYVACSYINDKKFATVRSSNSVIYGFDRLNSGALYGMGNTDIDSIGPYSSSYNGSFDLMDQGSRAHFFVPSLLISTSLGYNEVVIERRSEEADLDGEFKRTPDYIIGMVDSLIFDKNISTLDEFFDKEMSFLSNQDRESLKGLNGERNYLKVLHSYIDEFRKINSEKPKEAAKSYCDKIDMYKSYENTLKAASEFNLPVVLIDKTYYFRRMLESSNYDKYQREELYQLYESKNINGRNELIEKVSLGVSYGKIVDPTNKNSGVTILL